MIFKDVIEKFGVNLKELIKSGQLEIIFGSIEPVDEFNVPIKSEGFKISVRNKYDGGASGNNIEHDPTVKIIAGTIFKYDGMLGLPITISDDPKIFKNADNDYNRKNAKKYMKTTKKFIKDNRSELDEYWELNPQTKEGSKRLKELEKEIRGKYE